MLRTLQTTLRKGHGIVAHTCIWLQLGIRKTVDVTRSEVVEFYHYMRGQTVLN